MQISAEFRFTRTGVPQRYPNTSLPARSPMGDIFTLTKASINPKLRRESAYSLMNSPMSYSRGGSQTWLPVQQHVTESRGANVSPTIQRLGGLGKALRHNVAPWGSGPTGSDYEVNTDSGSTLSGWSAYKVWKYELSFWCHGHSLGTFYKDGYSIYSGGPMKTVVQDEWHNVPPDQTKAEDIAVWTRGHDHSAKFTQPVIESGQLVPDKSMLSTKNGQDPLAVKTLTDIMGTYGSAGVAVFRHN
jgi:hypothetical protein